MIVGTILVTGCGLTDRNPTAATATATDTAATLKRYCSECHNPIDLSGGLSFNHLDAANVGNDPNTWERIVKKLRTRTMPPQDSQRPDAATYDSTINLLQASLDQSSKPEPGPPALRRLNRAEYANSIRDLLDLEVDVKDLLPPDDSAFGFDNNGSLLVFSPTLLERYLTAADRVSALAVGDPETVVGAKTYKIKGDESQGLQLEGLPLGTVGGMGVDHTFPLDANYEFSLALLRNNLEVIRGLEYAHQIEITVDGERVFVADVGGSADADRPGATVTERSDVTDARLHVRVPVSAGTHRVAATFIRQIGASTNRLRPFDRTSSDTYDSTGRPHIETLTVTGPYEPTGAGDTPSRRRVFSCRPADASDEVRCAQEILTNLARRAYRRPIGEADLARLMPFYENGRAHGTFDTGIQLALRRILASPSFAFRVETDPADVAPGSSYYVTDIELASRLSFFLWSSIPDDELLDVAAHGKLHDSKVLETQTRRMLADPKASAFVDNFAGQWLHLRNLENINPNSDEFPDFDNNLRQAFRQEAEMFFASVINENRSVLDLMTADYTFVDERLAHHYGIPNVYGSRFRRVTLGPEFAARNGLLGKGGVLMSTSHADRTAPTVRGKWILENLLGTPPPPPPGNVPALETKPGAAPLTMRERLQTHRANPTCAGCHNLLDPLGFALENYDAIGSWRTVESGNTKVNATGRVADGTAVEGVVQLREALLRNPELFAATVTERLMTYALGRGLQYYDMPVERAILRNAKDGNYRFSSIVLGIVDSVPFRMRSTATNDGTETAKN